MKIVKVQDQLPIEVVDIKVIENEYTKKLESAILGEKIIIDSVSNNFHHFISTRKTSQKLFSEGFVAY